MPYVYNECAAVGERESCGTEWLCRPARQFRRQRVGLNGELTTRLLRQRPQNSRKGMCQGHSPIPSPDFLPERHMLLSRGGAKFSRHHLRRRAKTFTTSGSGNQAPFVSTNGATGISSSSATLNCYVNPYSSSNTTRWFEWGSTQSFGNKTGVVNHGTVTANGNEIISGLSNNTTYYFRCAAQNQYGTSYGSVLSFWTGTGGGRTADWS